MPQKKKASAKTAAVKSTAARKASKPATKTAKEAAKTSKKTMKRAGAKTVSVKSTARSQAAVAKKHPTAKAAVKQAKQLKPSAKKPTVLPAKKPVVAAKPVAPKVDIAKIVGHARPAVTPAVTVAKSVPAAVAKQAAQRISSPPITPQQQAAKALELQRQQQIAAAATAAKKPVNTRHGFKTNEFIVYPAHGVGRIVGIEEQEIAGMALELFVITFEKDKMTLRVPTGKLQSVGMRKLADEAIVKRAMETLKGRARIKRTMWSRRAQEYEAKINSGDLISIAEVVRDLYRSETQPEQSYSERQLYEAALDRMAREIAAVDKLDERGAVQKITEVLSRSAKGRRVAEEEADAAEGDEEVQAA